MPVSLIAFRLEGGGTVFVESDQPVDRGGLVGRADLLEAGQTFQEAVSCIRPVADAVLGQITALASRPSEITVELGVSLKAEAGVVIAKTAGEGSFKLTLKWKDNN